MQRRVAWARSGKWRGLAMHSWVGHGHSRHRSHKPIGHAVVRRSVFITATRASTTRWPGQNPAVWPSSGRCATRSGRRRRALASWWLLKAEISAPCLLELIWNRFEVQVRDLLGFHDPPYFLNRTKPNQNHETRSPCHLNRTQHEHSMNLNMSYLTKI
jgi:hypothetical protein